jgi:hypothetical protein
MAYPWVADGGRPPDMEGSCRYIEKEIADKRHYMIFQLGSGKWG